MQLLIALDCVLSRLPITPQDAPDQQLHLVASCLNVLFTFLRQLEERNASDEAYKANMKIVTVEPGGLTSPAEHMGKLRLLLVLIPPLMIQSQW